MRPAAATLVSLDDSPHIRIDMPLLVIGRSLECDVVVDSKKVSRKHCCLALGADFLLVRDLGSTNGIRVNGERCDEGRVTEGDEVTIGNLRYRLEWDVKENAAPPAATRERAMLSDSLIERCDQPVLLPEPGPIPLGDDEGRKSAKARPKPGDTGWLLAIPDDVGFAPDSDDKRGGHAGRKG